MNRDTLPDGHHSKNNPRTPSPQSDKGVPTNPDDIIEDDERNDDDGLIDFTRELQRQGIKVVIKPEKNNVTERLRDDSPSRDGRSSNGK